MKKSDMNKAQVAVLGYGVLMAMGATFAPVANAACTPGTTTAGVVCAIANTEAPITVDVNFTGSNEVTITFTGNTTGFGACGFHTRGTSSYGSSLAGGSGIILTGTVANPRQSTTANISGGC